MVLLDAMTVSNVLVSANAHDNYVSRLKKKKNTLYHMDMTQLFDGHYSRQETSRLSSDEIIFDLE
jgi:hypothetical protein